MWDVIVVGAGPAGCHAARMLGCRGWRVLLVDKSRFPRWKPCAGAITVKAEPYYPRELRGLIEHVVAEAVLSCGADRSTRVCVERPVGWLVHRETFDKAHFELASATAGVEVIEGCRVTSVHETPEEVTVEASSGSFRGRVVIGADGASSVVSEAVRDPAGRSFSVAFEGEARYSTGVERPALRFDFAHFPSGYGWVFPKAQHCSVGGGAFAPPAPHLKACYETLCAGTADIRACETYRTRGFLVPQGGTRQRLNGRRTLLVGDAADTVDPVTGEGIAYAFRSAHLASQAVHCFLESSVPLDGYTRQIAREMHSEFRIAGRLARWLYSDPARGYEVLFRNELLCRWFVEVLRGELTYKRLLWRAALRLPRLRRWRGGEAHLRFDYP
ncbi:MAG: geranylgeranyl reductase family protein [Planctomycetota bacterium]